MYLPSFSSAISNASKSDIHSRMKLQSMISVCFITQNTIISVHRNGIYRSKFQYWRKDLYIVGSSLLDMLESIQIRGIQYVHCVMHNHIMVKVGGKIKPHKLGKKTCKFN